MGQSPSRRRAVSANLNFPKARGRSSTALTPSKSSSKVQKYHEKNAYEKWELDLLQKVFADLALRSVSSSSNTVNKDTFLRFFERVPGLLAERLFIIFDRDKKGELDFRQFTHGLYRLRIYLNNPNNLPFFHQFTYGIYIC